MNRNQYPDPTERFFALILETIFTSAALGSLAVAILMWRWALS